MSSVTSTRNLAAFLGIGALTLTLAACGNDDDGDSTESGLFSADSEEETHSEPDSTEEETEEAEEDLLEEDDAQDPAQEEPHAEEDPLEEEDDDEEDSTRLAVDLAEEFSENWENH